MLEVLMANKAVVLGAMLAISELLSVMPMFKSNGIIQLVINFLKQMLAPKA